ncbi:MAG: glutathione S-transferase family protein [Gammaproteobacteria bacterium]|nr:glutathione S-transferase family protein [Gammaproteobacteria bacterium]
MQNPMQLIGSPASPYTQKMLALLRYRHISYAVIWGDPTDKLNEMGVSLPKMVFLPTFLLPDSDGSVEAVCDSTPIIRALEERYSERSVVPTDPALALIDYLLEDFGDEWCTKYMFHYRWYPEADADNAGTLLPLLSGLTMPEEQHAQEKSAFTTRQIERLKFVGSNDSTAPVIEASYRRLLTLLDAHFCQFPFLLGYRPGASDFAIMGQFSQLVGFDPTSRAIALQYAPRTVAWVALMEDQSGVLPTEDDWIKLDTLPATLKALLGEIGRVYVPALRANAAALANDENHWEMEIDGHLWRQRTFSYQAKCFTWIRNTYHDLSPANRCRVDNMLAGTGCEVLFTESS